VEWRKEGKKRKNSHRERGGHKVHREEKTKRRRREVAALERQSGGKVRGLRSFAARKARGSG
jgi:hypothetical protein